MKSIVSGSLILSFLLALFPSAEALAAMAPMEERAGQKAAYYREIIMRDVPECTWDILRCFRTMQEGGHNEIWKEKGKERL